MDWVKASATKTSSRTKLLDPLEFMPSMRPLASPQSSSIVRSRRGTSRVIIAGGASAEAGGTSALQSAQVA